MKIANLFAAKPSKPRPKKWRVTFYREDGKTVACTGLYDRKGDAQRAVEAEGAKHLTPVY